MLLWEVPLPCLALCQQMLHQRPMHLFAQSLYFLLNYKYAHGAVLSSTHQAFAPKIENGSRLWSRKEENRLPNAQEERGWCAQKGPRSRKQGDLKVTHWHQSLAPGNPESRIAGMNQLWYGTTYSYILWVKKEFLLRHPAIRLLSITGSDLSQSGSSLQHSSSHYGESLGPKRLSRGCHHQCDYKRSPNCWVQWDGLNVYQPSCIWFFLSVLFNYGKILALWLRLFWEPRVTSAKDQEWCTISIQQLSAAVFWDCVSYKTKKASCHSQRYWCKEGKRVMGSSDSKLRLWNLRFI